MYKCPNCGAQMRYDIESAKLYCDYCNTSLEPEKHPTQSLDAKKDTYNVTVYTCPHCGGEIISADNAATDFCSYCGSSVVLESRFSNEKKPDLISPFKITKENCKSLYKDYSKQIWCMPNEFRDEQFLEKFVGIYMPFYSYDITQIGEGSLDGTVERNNATEYYQYNFDLNNEYNYILYDASALFDDDLSSCINDFSQDNAKDFSTAYLCGFYADSPNVPSSLYERNAKNYANKCTTEYITRQYESGSSATYTYPDYKEQDKNYNTTVKNVKNVLLPVWFLTWRNDNRVAYIAVNGENGHCFANFPVSIKKYILFSLLLSLPFMLLTYFLPLYTPDTMLSIMMVITTILSILYTNIVSKQLKRDAHINDKGYQVGVNKNDGLENALMENESVRKKRTWIAGLVVTILFLSIYFLINGTFISFLNLFNMVTANSMTTRFFVRFGTAIFGAVCLAILWIKSLNMKSNFDERKILIETIPLTVVIITVILIALIFPVHDIYFYIGTILLLLGVIYECVLLIHRYNLFCTKPLPTLTDRKKEGT